MNSALSAWQLALMAVVPLTALIAWIVTIFIVAREPRRPAAAAAATAPPVAAPVSQSLVSQTPGAETAGESERQVKEPVAA
jgi:hypothetical protein